MNTLHRQARHALALALALLMLLSLVRLAPTASAVTQGEWQYLVNSDGQTATLTRYNGAEETVVVPAIVNGYAVTTIQTQTFVRANDILHVLIPSTVTKMEQGAFYDLNNLQTVTIPGTVTDVGGGTLFESSGSPTVYTTPEVAQEIAKTATGLTYVTEGYNTLDVGITSDAGAGDDGQIGLGAKLMGYGEYILPAASATSAIDLPVEPSSGMALSALTVDGSDALEAVSGNALRFTVGSADLAVAVTLTGTPAYEDITIDTDYADGFDPEETIGERQYTASLRYFADQTEIDAIQATLEAGEEWTTNYARVVTDNLEPGVIYINGDPVVLADDVIAYDVSTGIELYEYEAGEKVALVPQADSAQGDYKAVGYKLSDSGDEIVALYYSPYAVDTSSQTATIRSSNWGMDGMSGRLYMDETFLTYANANIRARGAATTIDGDDAYVQANTGGDGVLTLDTTRTGNDNNAFLAEANQERSVLWATESGTIDVGAVDFTSTAKSNTMKMSYFSNLTQRNSPYYNEEITMQWGLNAVLYATEGGSISVGDETTRSAIYADGDGANGIIAVTTGDETYDGSTVTETSSVSVTNADFVLEGYNNHVADVMYGGYVELEDVTGTTGVRGSYGVGQASALANDFGSGVIVANNVDMTAYGRLSSGAYFIGTGMFKATDSSLKSYVDGGATVVSGGTFDVTNSTIEGQVGIRARGSGSSNVSSFRDSTIVATRAGLDEAGYVYGETAAAAVALWNDLVGENIFNVHMSQNGFTLGDLFDYLELDAATRTTLYTELGALAGEAYSADTPLRGSVLDNTYYNYWASAYRTDDYSSAPFTTIGEGLAGVTSAVLGFESAGNSYELTDNTYINENGDDFNFLIASESGTSFSGGSGIRFIDTDGVDNTVTGIIWNEGDAYRKNDQGRVNAASSNLLVSFENMVFSGSFADGYNGLWEVEGLEYARTYNIDASSTTTDTSSYNGNYHNATANWGITASFDGASTWEITYDSYVGSLTIEPGATLTPADGLTCAVTVDGVESSLDELMVGGTFEKVIITTDAGDNSGNGGGGNTNGGGSTTDPDEDVNLDETPDEETGITETLDDGTVVTTVTDEETGAMTLTVESADGTVTEVQISASGAVTAEIILPAGVSATTVRIPLDDLTSGTVAIAVYPDGTEEIIKYSVAEDGSLYIPVDGDVQIRIVDNSKAFTDADDARWAADAIAFVTARELFLGTSGTEFSPNQSMTRAMLATVLYRLEGEPEAGENPFDDVDEGKYYTDAVAWAAAEGIVNGVGDNTFAPNEEITREQLAAMLYRYVGSPTVTGNFDQFDDAEDVSSWAEAAMEWAVESGVIQGKTDTTIEPVEDATRAEVATMLQRFVTGVTVS